MRDGNLRRPVTSRMRKRGAAFFAGIVISCLLVSACFGQNTDESPRQSVRLSIHSGILNEERPLYITLPSGEKDGDYPVLYVLDGDGNTNIVSGIVDYLSFCKIIPKMIVVGIGNTDRIRDMTPSESKMFGNSGGSGKLP